MIDVTFSVPFKTNNPIAQVLTLVVERDSSIFQMLAGEILGYMQTAIVPEPRAVLLCVQQLLVAAFSGRHVQSRAKVSPGIAFTRVPDRAVLPVSRTPLPFSRSLTTF